MPKKPPCGCAHARRARDLELPPPSSRRTPRSEAAYRFAVESALVRHHGMTDGRAVRLAHRWRKLVETRRAEGRTPESTAEHVARFERQKIVSPYGRDKAKRCARGLEVQTIIFPKSAFTKARALAWARSQGMRSGKVDETSGSFRLRQRRPEDFVVGSFRTIAMGREGVKAVVGCPRPGRESDVRKARRSPR